MSLEILSKEEPSYVIEGEETDIERKKTKVKILGDVFRYSVNFFHKKGFAQLMPVMLGKSVDPLGPDPGSSIVEIPDIEYQGEKLSLTTSMILHKQVAIRDFEKIFIMSPNIRLEGAKSKNTGKHLFEFTQADFEIANAKTNDVLSLLEDYYHGLTQFLKEESKDKFEKFGLDIFEFKPPFKKYNKGELKKAYGEDWELTASLVYRQPFWVLDHKREFYDKEYPNKKGHYLNYDVVYPHGFGEGISGSEREYEYGRILKRIKEDGLDLSRYENYLKFAKEGFIPSAGAGIGMERLGRFLTRSQHIADMTMFKRVPGVPVDI